MSIELNQHNKQLVWDFWQALGNVPDDQCLAFARQAMRETMVWNGFDPVNQLHGVEVDMIHLFRQFGIDLLARQAEQKR